MKEGEIKPNTWSTSKEQFQNQLRPVEPYFQKAYDFIQRWLGFEQTFELRTSGSTGVPKVISVKRSQLTSSAAMTAKALSLGKGTRALVCLNVDYVAGVMMLVRGMELGWELVIIEPTSNPLKDFKPEVEFDFAALVPMQLSGTLEEETTRERVSQYGKILLGGAPISVSLLKQIEKINVPVYQSYGMTETVSHVALRRLNGETATDSYWFLPGVGAGVDERNCLFISGPVTDGEKIQTNDIVEMTALNAFVWLGRIDNVINSGGIKIVLDVVDEKIARVFYDLNYNNSFFTWYQQDEKLGQKLVLFVESDGERLIEEVLMEEIRKRVSTYETPKHVYFADRFIKTPTDKTDKRRTAETLFNNFNG
jgi:O-succinylbenzoic acid--CoA ligase